MFSKSRKIWGVHFLESPFLALNQLERDLQNACSQIESGDSYHLRVRRGCRRTRNRLSQYRPREPLGRDANHRPVEMMLALPAAS